MRGAFAFGDLAGSGTKNLILCGQSDADLQSGNLFTRYVALYAWNGTSFTSSVYKNFDLFAKNDGAYVYSAMNVSRPEDTFYSLPLCVSNVAVRYKGISEQTSVLYFDSLIISYDDSGLDIAEAWDNTQAMQSNMSNPVTYVEYGAAAGALTGNTGEAMIATMTQTLNSTNDVEASYTVTGSHQEAIWNQGSYYKNWWYRLWGIRTYYRYISGYQTVDDTRTVDCTVSQFNMGQASMVLVDPETSYISRTDTDFSMSLCLANTDNDTSYMKYDNNHYFTYTDPEVLAVISSPPYYADLLGRDDLSGNYGESTTSYSSTTGSSSGATTTASIQAGAYVSVEKEFSVFGVVVATAEAEASITTNFTWDFQESSSLEQTVTYSASAGEDMIAFYSIPMEIYEYTSYAANGTGGYDEVVTTVNVPHEAAVKLLSLDEYEAIAADYDALPQISGTILTHTVGDPSTYPSSTDGYSDAIEYSGDPAAVGYTSASGGSSISQEIEMSTEKSTSFSASVAAEFKAGAGAGGLTVGIIVGGDAGAGYVTTTTNGSSFSGEMQSMPIEAKDYGYALNWKIFCYEYKNGDLDFPVVNYLVSEYTMPPSLPTDFEQDVADTTSNSVTLKWTYDKLVSKFNIYRYYEFPDGSGSYIVHSVPMTEADSYDAETGTYYFSYTDTSLSPYTDYQYQIQTIGTGTQSNKSIYSEPITVRTKTEIGYPDITLTGLDNGMLLLYPDASSTVTATVADADPRKGEYKGLNYQWQKLADGEWVNISGAKDKSYTFSNSGSSDALTYRCRVNTVYYSKQSLSEYQISAYSDSFTTAYSLRTPDAALEVNVKDTTTLSSKIKLWSANAGHTSAPTGNVTFTIKSTDYEYNQTVKLIKSSDTELIDGIAKYYSTASFDLTGLKDGVYTVTAYYSGGRVFNSLSIDDGEIGIVGSGNTYQLALASSSGGDAITSFTYGDSIYPQLTYISKNAGGEAEKADLTASCTFSYSADGTDYATITPGSITPGVGTYTMKAVHGESADDYTTQQFTVEPRAITVSMENYSNVSSGSDVAENQPVPRLEGGSTMAGGEQLSDLKLTYRAYNSAGTETTLNENTKPGNYAIIGCESSETPAAKYANYDVTYTSGIYTVIGVTYALTVSTSDFTDSNGTRSVGTATIKGGGTTANYSSGTSVAMLAYPDSGYEVDKWTATFATDNKTTTQTGGTSFSIETQAQPVNVSVTFKASKYTLSTAVSPAAGGTISCDADSLTSGAYVATGAEFTFTAATAEGYAFSHWELSTGGSPVSYAGTSNSDGTSSYTVTVGKNSTTLYAVFVRDNYILNLSGNIMAYYWKDTDGLPSTPEEKTFISDGGYVPGDTEITVSPMVGYRAEENASYYINEAPAAADTDGTYTFTITDDTMVSLETQRGSFSASAEAEDNRGTVTISIDGEPQSGSSVSDIGGGSKVVFTAKANRGYTFDHWSVGSTDDAGITNADNTNSYTVLQLGDDVQVTAVFKANGSYNFTAALSNAAIGSMTYTLTDMYGDTVASGAVFGSGNQITTYNGDNLTLNVTPTSGSMVEQWLVNGTSTSTYDTAWPFENISQSYTTVIYLKASTGYTVSYCSGDYGTVTATANDAAFDSGTVLSGGSNLVFMAAPENGYMLDYWTMISGLNSTAEVPVTDSDGVNITTPVYSIASLNGHCTVKAYFKEQSTKNVSTENITGGSAVITYMTPVSPEGSGALSDVTSCDVRTGGSVKLTFTADSGYATDDVYLKNALENCGEAVTVTQNIWGRSYDVTIKNVTSDLSIQNCNPFYKLYAVSINSSENGSTEIFSVTPKLSTDYYEFSGRGVLVPSGSTVTVRLTPDTGFEVDSMSVDSNSVAPQYDNQAESDVMVHDIANVRADTSVDVSFMEIAPVITVTYGVLYKDTVKGSVSAEVARKGMDAYHATGEAATDTDQSVEALRDGQVTITATPEDNRYKFVSWTIDSEEYDAENPPEGISVNGDILTVSASDESNVSYQVEALFEDVGETITYSAEGSGELSVISSATGASFASGTKLAVDSDLTFTAEPEDGYVIEGWYLNNSKIPDETGTEYTYQYSADENIGADITVKFVRESYTVSYSAEHGSITKDGSTVQNSETIQGDTEVSLAASEDSSYEFSYWLADGENIGSDNPLNFTVTEDTAIEAVFEPFETTYTVTFTAGEGGTIDAACGNAALSSRDSVAAESEILLTAAPNTGYLVKEWKLNGVSVPDSSEQTTYTVSSLLSDVTLEVEFKPADTYTASLNLGAYPHGSITALVNGTAEELTDDTLSVSRHDTVQLTATPSAHYSFSEWGGYGDNGTADGCTLTLSDIQSDSSLTASFVAAEYIKFTAASRANGSLTVNAVSDGEESTVRVGTQVEIVSGSTVTLTAAPDSNYMVESWTKDGNAVSGNLSKTLVLENVTADTSAGVTFEEYTGYTIPVSNDTYSITSVSRTPDDTLPAAEIRKGGTVSFTLAMNENHYITQLSILGADCLGSEDTTTQTDAGTVRTVPNVDGSYTITLSNISGDIVIAADEYNLSRSEFSGDDETKARMQTAVKNKTSGQSAESAVYEVELKVKNENGEWEAASEADLPESGIVLTFPYPDGITYQTASQYNFIVAHLISTGENAGTIEYLTPTKAENGLSVTVYSLSPFAVGWAEKTTSGGGSGGGSSTTTSYGITVTETGHGCVPSSVSKAASGTSITLTPLADAGYALESLTATDSDGNTLTLVKNSGGRYGFTMPDSDVYVSAEFAFSCTGETDCPSASFTDVDKGKWYHEGIDFALRNGLFTSTAETTFEPEAAMSRAMMVTVLYRLAGSPGVSGDMSFTDVAESSYYYDAVLWACKNNIVSGYGDDILGSDDNLTREQLAAILYRFAVFKNYDVTSGADLTDYADSSTISGYAETAFGWANAAGLITGVTPDTLAPQQYATRAQVAVILMRFSENVAK